MKTISPMKEQNLSAFSRDIVSLKETPEVIPSLIYPQIDSLENMVQFLFLIYILMEKNL